MSYRRICSGCSCVISEYSRQYYCCDLDQPVCVGCRSRPCPRCSAARTEIPLTPCKICRRPTPNPLSFQEPNCHARYCARCVSGLYLPLLMANALPSQIELNCGHSALRKEIEQYLQAFCVNCGGRSPSAAYY